ncbi:sugar phosphate isomerase/epimerase family protein [Planctomonas psychrotolerans]|uniref:sugar phosphate isomerase/epimerase family protein n=1 Tax=Planctomonas psychrotolerans TaxID=2528712 RepID=UPI001238FA53|nr:sugar phosphate isomerase/epimerase family protein [Planctomonas psychrotolerans]
MPREYEIGVIVPSDRADATVAGGADYVEPTIVGNLVVETAPGKWARNPEYVGPAACPSFAILFPGDMRLSDPDFPAERVTAYLAAAMGIIASAASSGAKIVFGSGKARSIPDGVDREAGEKRFAEVVREARDVAAANDLAVILEPLNTGETNLLNSIVEAADFLDRHGIEGVPIVADLYHIMLEEEPLDVLLEHGPRIGHAHIADTGRVPPGQGDWPLPEFLDTLDRAGYRGTVSIECTWADFESELPAALAHLRALA